MTQGFAGSTGVVEDSTRRQHKKKADNCIELRIPSKTHIFHAGEDS
jgi:hypothetical protein